MQATIKSKLYLGIGMLAGFVLLLWVSGSVFINTLADNSGAIIQDNIRSVSYAEQMEQALNTMFTSRLSLSSGSDSAAIESKAFNRHAALFEKILGLQEQNITEKGEVELTGRLRANFEEFLTISGDSAEGFSSSPAAFSRLKRAYGQLQQNLSELTKMNVDAIHRKNDIAQRTASNVIFYLSLIGGFCSILGIIMLVRFPNYIVDPIEELISRIKKIANKNYDQKLKFSTGDEYEELAEAFNRMAGKLQEYESSNISRIMSEKKRIETIVNHMGDAVIGLDADNCILFANDKALELLGKTKEAISGRYAQDVASESDLFRRVFRVVDRDIDEPENYIKIDDMSETYYSVEVSPIRHLAGKGFDNQSHLGNIITLKNVTRFHELDQAKTNFISMVSHELKTPISSINMSLRLLEDNRIGGLNREQQDLVSNIRKDVFRMKKTTAELLDLTKIETGNIQMNMEEVLPSDLLEYAFETMVLQAAQKELDLLTEADGGLPLVQADSQKTVWVLVNLISNAIRYTDPGGRITLKAEAADEGYVRFSVTDTGEGIAPDDLEKVFDKYYRVEKKRKEKMGTGLGLSISKEFITAQGGEIWAESKVGEGSTFNFLLPVSRLQSHN